MSYGVDIEGAKPADLPVEQPTKYQLVVSQDGNGHRHQVAHCCSFARRRGD
jgi:hypothetical protein